MAGKYKKCPRCELNYILVDEELCQVCKTELKLAPSEDEDDMELCTLCGKNLITVDQVMCDECARKRNIDDVVDEVSDDDEEGDGKDTVSEWDQQKDDDLGGMVDADDDVEVVSFSDLEDEEEDDDYEDEDDDVDHFEEEDDFDLDDIDDYDDDDDDEDDDDDDDDDDFLTIKKK